MTFNSELNAEDYLKHTRELEEAYKKLKDKRDDEIYRFYQVEKMLCLFKNFCQETNKTHVELESEGVIALINLIIDLLPQN